MSTVAAALVALIAIEHVYILIVEMFLWTTAYGRRAFALTEERAAITAPLAKNQGLYNGFLAAGLAWALIARDPAEAYHLKLFFSACVAIAGAYGGATAGKKILFLQGGPGLAALIATIVAGA